MPSAGDNPRSLMSLMTVGIVLVLCIVIGYFLGSFLDGKMGTEPWLSVAGVLLGTGAGFVELFRTVSRSLK